MRVSVDNLWLCDDCMMAAVNDDYSSLDYHYDQIEAAERMVAIRQGLTRLGPHLVTASDTPEEFMTRECDCCGDPLHGTRHRFAILEPEYCEPLCAGPASETRAVAARLGRLLTALDHEISGYVINGTLIEDITKLKRDMVTKLREQGWAITYSDTKHRYQVKGPK